MRRPVFSSAAGRVFTIDPNERSLGMQLPLPIGIGVGGRLYATEPPPP